MNNPSIPALSQLPELNDQHFSQWQALLEERTGMCISTQRKRFLQTGLGFRMRELGCSDYSEYYEQVLQGPRGAIEWNRLLDRLTVRETRFFRDADAFELVKNYLFNRRTWLQNQCLEMWSVGCSTGEEAYSLAILADQFAGSEGLAYSVTGTDISHTALRAAHHACYSMQAARHIPPDYARAYVESTGKGTFSLPQRIKERCCFAQVNLLHLDSFPLQSQHIIYCQNVLIYFRRWRRKEILNLLVERMVPGGLLVIGSGEMVDWHHPDLEACHGGAAAFIKKSDSADNNKNTGAVRR